MGLVNRPFLYSGLYKRLSGIGVSASLDMMCIIFIVHTMPDFLYYFKMVLPSAYSATTPENATPTARLLAGPGCRCTPSS